MNRRDVTKKCRELAGKLSRGDVTHETAKDLSDDDGYLHSDDEGITDLPLASSLVEHALDALVEQGEVKKTGDDYALVVDDDGDWFVSVFRIASRSRPKCAQNRKRDHPRHREMATSRVDGVEAPQHRLTLYQTQVRRPREPAPQVPALLEASRIV